RHAAPLFDSACSGNLRVPSCTPQDCLLDLGQFPHHSGDKPCPSRISQDPISMTYTIDLLDPSTRPKAPRIEGATDAHRRRGRRLAMIHEMHLRQMAHVRQVMEHVA